MCGECGVFAYVVCGTGLACIRVLLPCVVGSNIESCVSKGIPSSGLFCGRTRFHVDWNPSLRKVNAAAARTSMSRSLTTGEVVWDRITDSTVSINFFDAVWATHVSDWGKKAGRKVDRQMKRLFEFCNMMAHSLAALNCAGGSAYLCPSQYVMIQELQGGCT